MTAASSSTFLHSPISPMFRKCYLLLKALFRVHPFLPPTATAPSRPPRIPSLPPRCSPCLHLTLRIYPPLKWPEPTFVSSPSLAQKLCGSPLPGNSTHAAGNQALHSLAALGLLWPHLLSPHHLSPHSRRPRRLDHAPFPIAPGASHLHFFISAQVALPSFQDSTKAASSLKPSVTIFQKAVNSQPSEVPKISH